VPIGFAPDVIGPAVEFRFDSLDVEILRARQSLRGEEIQLRHIALGEFISGKRRDFIERRQRGLWRCSGLNGQGFEAGRGHLIQLRCEHERQQSCSYHTQRGNRRSETKDAASGWQGRPVRSGRGPAGALRS